MLKYFYEKNPCNLKNIKIHDNCIKKYMKIVHTTSHDPPKNFQPFHHVVVRIRSSLPAETGPNCQLKKPAKTNKAKTVIDRNPIILDICRNQSEIDRIDLAETLKTKQFRLPFCFLWIFTNISIKIS